MVVLIIAVVAMLLFSLVPISFDVSDWYGDAADDSEADFLGAIFYALATLAVGGAAALGAVGIGLLAVGMARVSRRHAVLTWVALLGFLVLSYGVMLVLGGEERLACPSRRPG